MLLRKLQCHCNPERNTAEVVVCPNPCLIMACTIHAPTWEVDPQKPSRATLKFFLLTKK